MRKVQIVIAAVGGLLVGLSGSSQELAAQPADNAKAEATPNGGSNGGASSDKSGATGARQPQQERPFLCFGDAACEREMARQKRAVDPMPLRPGSQKDADEGPLIHGIPGQTEVPGFTDTPTPVVPGN